MFTYSLFEIGEGGIVVQYEEVVLGDVPASFQHHELW